MARSLILIIAAVTITLAASSKIDWSQIHPRDILPDVLRGLPTKYIQTNGIHQGRITGGQEAPKHAFPYQVGLMLELEEFRSFCGGSLISDQWVLTAAHCADGAKSVLLHFGAHHIQQEEDRVEMLSTEFIVHEEWDRDKVRNDIALIKLPEPVKFSDKIQPVKLPRKSDVDNNFEGEPAVASGWGKDSDESTVISPVLRYIETQISSLAVCKLMYLFVPTDNNICIGGANGISTCNGDSGGPLVVYEADGTPILVGATSFGSNFGCEKGFPAAFTRITSYLDWINKHTNIPLR